jgi:TonB family protein
MIKLKFLIASFLLLCCGLFSIASAQEPKNIAAAEWQRIESESKDFSIAMPGDFKVFVDANGFRRPNPKKRRDEIFYGDLRSISAFQDGTMMSVERYRVTDSVKALDALLVADAPNCQSNSCTTREINFENFTGRQYAAETSDLFITSFYLAAKNHIYFVTAANRNRNKATLNRFISSLRLGGKSFSSEGGSIEENELAPREISMLESDSVEIEYAKPSAEKIESSQQSLKTGVAGSPASIGSAANQKSVMANETRPAPSNSARTSASNTSFLAVIFQPRPGYTEEARKNNLQGDVRLRVHFSANGHIKQISVINGLPFGLTEMAVNAARRLRFLPMEKNETPVSVIKILEYRFRMY